MRKLAALVMIALAQCVWSTQGIAESGRIWESESDNRALVVTLFKSRTIRLVRPFATAVVGSQDIADAMPVSDHSLYILGKKVGTTNLSIFDENQRLINVIDLEIAIDAKTLREKIVSSTGSRGIRISSSNGQVILSGQANDAVSMRAASSGSTGSPVIATARGARILGKAGLSTMSRTTNPAAFRCFRPPEPWRACPKGRLASC
jgi:pilus assembly protein CpaC